MYVKGTKEILWGLFTVVDMMQVYYGLYSQPDRNLGDRNQVVKPSRKSYRSLHMRRWWPHYRGYAHKYAFPIPHGLRSQNLIGGDVSLWLAFQVGVLNQFPMYIDRCNEYLPT